MLRGFPHLAGIAAVLLSAAAWAQERGILCAGTRFETSFSVIDSGKPGPTVMIIAGMHGNEPAGIRAAEEMRHWPVLRGRIILLPRANAPGIAANTRNIPGESEENANLNRNFPSEGGPEKPLGPLAEAIWKLVADRKPDWLVDLHEGIDYRKLTKTSAGAGLIRVREPEVLSVSELMLAAVNATVDDPDHQLVPMITPAKGALARAAWEKHKARAMILETCQKEPLARRVRQHRIMVHRLLTHLKMVECDVDLITPPARRPGELRVAVYCGGGVGSAGALRVEECLAGQALVRLVSAEGISAGVLGQFDAVVFPGGTGKGTAEALGEKGREAVRRFVGEGGGYLGICAGAYLATSGYAWGLKIINAKTVDSQHWKRGTGKVKMELTEAGRRLLGGAAGELPIYYANGPLLAGAGMDNLEDFAPLAHFRSEMRENAAPVGVMLNTPAMIAAPFEKGRVVLFSPHPERDPALRGFVTQAVRWAARRER